MTISSALHYGEAQLISSSTARLDAQILLGYVMGLSKTQLFSEMYSPLEASIVNTYKALLDRRIRHEPIAYIIKEKQFYSYDFYVDSRVLIPRPESESLVDLSLANLADKATLLEVGTGSGCIAIALKNKRSDACIHASDSSSRALAVARKNAHIHQAEVDFRDGYFLDPWDKNFDIIIANLPYLPDDISTQPDLHYEPRSALLGGGDGLEMYRKFIPQALTKLNHGGIIAIEHLPSQYESVHAICKSFNAQAESFDPFVTQIIASP